MINLPNFIVYLKEHDDAKETKHLLKNLGRRVSVIGWIDK